ncbi:ABC transporter ATP-binding protein [Rhodocytophaga aerolata]|uniref:ABC transporter ATP-binding protein n=1 Tax=Rhodocytophaga aerolata TaxID=455078 RepID=A0ABT8RE33_9BACT|nr:ABC transporter ATP-binding protein [Rhodocytophaga aerolata]MDO1449604.1 ABC transporter ATP-binding protein [Rhodocytophaga aerolata]
MIQVKNLVVGFEKDIVLNNLSFEVEKGAKVAIKGLSGSGKSTLLKTLMGFIIPQSGEIKILGKPLHKNHILYIRSNIAWLPQELNLSLNNARDLLIMPFSFARNKALTPDEKDIESIFFDLGLECNLLNKSLHEISGGQKQRIALASCVLLKRPLLFLDEPTSALDAISKHKVISYLFGNPELTILSLSHDEDWIRHSSLVIDLSSSETRVNQP